MNFERSCLSLQSRLISYANYLTHGHEAESQDLVQETMLKAFEAWPRFRLPSEADDSAATWIIGAWLQKILFSIFVNHYHKTHTRRAAEQHWQNIVADLRDDVGTEATHDEVDQALENLSPEHREIVVRADLRGQKYRDIARDLAMPIGTVMSRLHRARARLGAELEPFAIREYGIALQRTSEIPA